MSIATEISRIQTATNDIKTAITGKGVTVPEGSKIEALPALITSIPSGGGGLVFPDLWLPGTLNNGSQYQTTYAYTYLVVDCKDINYLDFTYDINQASNSSYATRLVIMLAVGRIPYITNEVANIPGWKDIDTGSATIEVVNVAATGSSIKGGTYSYNVTNKTVVTIQLHKESRVSQGYGSIHVYDIKGRS